MGDWKQTFNDIFFISIGSMVIGLLTVAIKYGYKSKCREVNLFCGLIKINRDVQLENNETSDDEEKNKQNSPKNKKMEMITI